VTIVGPTEARPADGLAVDFVVESDRAPMSEIVQRVRDGRLRTNIGNVSPSTTPSPPSTRPSAARRKTVIRVSSVKRHVPIRTCSLVKALIALLLELQIEFRFAEWRQQLIASSCKLGWLI